MLILQATEISKSYGITPILTKLSLHVHAKDKIGIIGANGAGKSTFLKIISGQLSYDSGSIQIGKETRLSYLAQDSGLESDTTIWNEMLSVFSSIYAMEQQLRDLETSMTSLKTHEDTRLEKVMEQYSLLQETFERSGGYQLESDVRNILAGLGFANIAYKEMKISQCSGGQKTRLALAKILLSKPDIILLDEPTNYLDIEALRWLEQFIKEYPGTLIVVSHDRYFLDSFVTVIYEIENNEGITYQGNYSRYLVQKEQRLVEQQKRFVQQQEEISKLEDFVQRNIARATTSSRAKSRQKQLEKIERLDPVKKQSATFFSFQAKKRSGNVVLDIKNLSMAFPQQSAHLFQKLNLFIERGERIAIIGANGTGKSTLLKLIAQKQTGYEGDIIYGSNVQVGYYDQEQQNLRADHSIFSEIHDDFPHMTKTEVRSALAQFLFTGDDVEKRIDSLSGGEKARVALTKLMLSQDNLLLLDEPTNHLDIAAKEVLEQALLDYEGTILMVSHDRFFLNRIATKIIYMTPENLQVYHGNYDYYLEKQLLPETSAPEDTPLEQKQTHEQLKQQRNADKQLLRRYEQVEASIQEYEQEITELEQQLCNPEIFDNYTEIQRIQQLLDTRQSSLLELLDEWERLTIEKEQRLL